MEYVNLGKCGLKVSRLCLGCFSFGDAEEWMLDTDKTRPIMDRAIDLGVTFFDTAITYSEGRSEEILGEIIKGRRDDLVISTKAHPQMGGRVGQGGLSRVQIMRQMDASLKNLNIDFVDLYQIHRWDYDTPIEETLDALDDLVRAGKTRYIGGSSMYAWQFSKALCTSDLLGLTRFVSMQNHYNLCYREEEREMIPLCNDQGIGLIPWSPLARGFLTGKYKRGETPESVRFHSDENLATRFFKPEDFDVVEEVARIADERDVKPAQISLAWLLHKGVVAPIVGATKVQHIEEAVDALTIRLESDEMKRLEASYRPHPIMGAR